MILRARITGEIRDHIDQLDAPNGLQCCARTAPATRWSGRSALVIARRLAHTQKSHTALRALANQWLEILWQCLT